MMMADASLLAISHVHHHIPSAASPYHNHDEPYMITDDAAGDVF